MRHGISSLTGVRPVSFLSGPGGEELELLQRYDFQQIYEDYRPRVRRYLAGLAGKDMADDLCQDVFVKIAGGLSGFREESSLSTWIYRVATNTFRDYLRSRCGRQQQNERPLSHDMSAEDVPGAFAGPVGSGIDQTFIRKEMIDCVRDYIEQLPEDYRIVLLLSEEEGFKNREIAEIMQVSLDNVKVRLHRARARLKETLKNHCEFYLDGRSEIACDRKQDRD